MANSYNSSDDLSPHNITLAADDATRLKRLLSLFGTTEESTLRSRGPETDNDLRAKAYSIRAARRKRCELLPPGIFGEPAWDALLELFIARGHQRLSLKRLAHYAKTPMTTLLRWLQYLGDQGIIVATKSPTDARTSIVDLTDDGAGRMSALLSRMHNESD